MLNGNGVKRFERLDHTKRSSVLLYDTEPSRAVRRVRGFEYASVNLTLYELAYILVYARGYRYVAYDPGLMFDRRNFDRWEEVFSKVTSFCVVPGESVMVNHHEVMHKVSFDRPKKVARMCIVNVPFSFESVASAGVKRSRMF